MFLFKELHGYSGASVNLAFKNGKIYFVRKIAKSNQDSGRLKQQIEKQISFSHKNVGIFKCPAVLDTGYIDNKFYVDMEYIAGADAIHYLSTANYSDVINFKNNICEYINYLHETKNNSQSLNLQNIKNKILYINNTYLHSDILDKSVAKLDNNINKYCTDYHGDLTLENIIINQHNSIYLIDFLDSTLEHYWQDISKLYQDLSGGWYSRKSIYIARCVHTFISDEIYKLSVALDSDYEYFHNLFIMFNFLRIIPYTKTEEEKQFIIKRIEFFGGRL